MTGGPTVVLFTRDLRAHDHPALADACERGPVVPLFVLEPRLLARSANRARFLLESLADLDASLRERGASLVLREGDTAAEVAAVAREAGATRVHLSADRSAFATRRESALRDAGLETVTFPGHPVVEPGVVAPPGKDHYRVFTPYHRAWERARSGRVLDAPPRIQVAEGVAPGPRPDPASVTPDAVTPVRGGERVARELVARFAVAGVRDYADLRNDAAADGTSRLSPYLRFGCVSAREAALALADAPELVRQLAWRDFFFQLLAVEPSLGWRNLREPAGDPAPPVPGGLAAWAEGRTGLPYVDAGMRQMIEEGWMHGRPRQVVASVLVKRLGYRWQDGLTHFDRLLLDGDAANDAGNWQWVAGTGTDTRPSRVFNPVLQARRYDPDGAYIRRWVPELAGLPTDLVFAPWTDPGALARTGYPPPIVEVRT